MSGTRFGDLDRLCVNALRALSIDQPQAARSGHPGLPLGAAPMAYVLWQNWLKHSPDGFTNAMTYPLGRTPPQDEPTRLADLERFFGQSPRFAAAHPFPTFRRYGFADLPSFMKGFHWRLDVQGQRLVRPPRQAGGVEEQPDQDCSDEHDRDEQQPLAPGGGPDGELPAALGAAAQKSEPAATGRGTRALVTTDS